jgi:hypothetical protein
VRAGENWPTQIKGTALEGASLRFAKCLPVGLAPDEEVRRCEDD